MTRHPPMTTWPEVLGDLVARQDLSADQTSWAMAEVLPVTRPRRRSPASPSRCAPRARRSRRSTGLADAMLAAANPISVPGRLLDVVGTGDGPLDVGQHLDDGGDRGGRGRGDRGQARQPLGVVDGRLGRRAGGARHPARPAAGAGRGGRRRGGITFCFSAAFHPAMRHAAVPRRELGIGTTFNFLGPARQPEPAGRPGDRLRRRADGAGDGGGLRRPRGRRLGVPRGRRPRRADDDHDVLGVDGPRRGTSSGRRWTPATWACRPRPPRTCAVATRRTTPTSYAASWRVSRGRSATPCCSTPERRWRCTPPRRATWPPASRRASTGPGAAVDDGGAARGARALGRGDVGLRAA